MLKEVFTLIDKDGDKQLSGDELKAWLEKVHLSLIEENVNQQWNFYQPEVQEVHSWESYDPEKRETISWEHYVKSTYPDDVLQAVNSTEEVKSEDPNFKSYLQMYKRAVKRWKAADKNGDNFLVKEEFTNFIHPEESDETKHILVEEAMEDMDSDGNKEVSLSEYVKHMSDVSQEEEKEDANFWQNQQSQFATYLDKDKDGVLNLEELNEWLVPNYDRHEAEAVRMIHDTDTNGDQALNHDEVFTNDEYFLNLIPAEFWRRYSDAGDTTTVPTNHQEL
ncbi:PREDICTED: calumenin-A-like [Rhagoletis zephyria]|uniref:calumenin-A-like n=1 Tax=Rhagoletis zephyria TaxID=28612 RepID=UPI00081130CC|nr:PREDICTED: calumenin-A-like [Rhagoletis zephyria]